MAWLLSAAFHGVEPALLVAVTPKRRSALYVDVEAFRLGGIESTESFGTPRILIAGNFWIKWTEISAEHANAAADARQRAVAASAGTSEMGQAFDDELKSTLVAVTSAAFAIDAWYIAVKDMIPLPPHVVAARSAAGARPARYARVMDTLQAGFMVGPANSKWGGAIKGLFQLRDGVVHFVSEAHQARPHPTGMSNVSRENVVYSAEAAVHAAQLAAEIISTCLSSPRPALTDLRKWCGEYAHAANLLTEKTQRLAVKN